LPETEDQGPGILRRQLHRSKFLTISIWEFAPKFIKGYEDDVKGSIGYERIFKDIF
jgi:hypothetical protein